MIIDLATALAARRFHLKLDGDVIEAPIEADLLRFAQWCGELLEAALPLLG